MSLKLRSALISFGSILFIVIVMGATIYSYVLSGFQTVENQRVERNIKSLSFALSDRYKQLEAKLADWRIWDDSYNFMTKRNQAYIDSNLTLESFSKIGVDEVLFVDKNGALIESLLVPNGEKETRFPEDIYSHFATGSALTKMDKKISQKSGLLKTDDGLILFSVGNVLKSDESGPANGVIMFGTYLDSRILTTIENLTQFSTQLVMWEDEKMSPDFTEMKDVYVQKGEKKKITQLNQKTIAGYLVIEDVYGKPQGMLRLDVARDITQQGKASMITLMIVLIISGLLGALLNNLLVTGVVLKDILGISREIKDLSNTQSLTKRMAEGSGNDELNVLRININNMLSDIEKSQQLLNEETTKRKSLIELIDSIVVALDREAHITMINEKGSEILGYTKEELIGKDWLESIVAPKERERVRRKFTTLMDSDKVQNTYIENSIITKDKKILTYGWHNTILKNSKGQVVSSVSVGNDITQKKQEELAKEDYTNTLKRLNEIMVGRELKMIELKEKLKRYET